jgi:hypothetical protein
MLIVEKHIVLQPAGRHPRDFGNPGSRYFFLLKPPIDPFFCFFRNQLMSGVLNKLPVTISTFKVLFPAIGGAICNTIWRTATETIHGIEN